MSVINDFNHVSEDDNVVSALFASDGVAKQPRGLSVTR